MSETEDSCLFCDATDDLEEHHVVPRKFGGTDDESNLITVCSSCHKKIERTWDRRFYEQLGVRADMTSNMMFDALKEIRFTLQRTKAAVEGAYSFYDRQLESAGDTTVDDYGGTVTRRQVIVIKREAYRELLEGDWYEGVIPLEDLQHLDEYSYRVLEGFEEGSS